MSIEYDPYEHRYRTIRLISSTNRLAGQQLHMATLDQHNLYRHKNGWIQGIRHCGENEFSMCSVFITFRLRPLLTMSTLQLYCSNTVEAVVAVGRAPFHIIIVMNLPCLNNINVFKHAISV